MTVAVRNEHVGETLMYPGGVEEGFLPQITRKQKDIKETGKGHFTQKDW